MTKLNEVLNEYDNCEGEMTNEEKEEIRQLYKENNCDNVIDVEGDIFVHNENGWFILIGHNDQYKLDSVDDEYVEDLLDLIEE